MAGITLQILRQNCRANGIQLIAASSLLRNKPPSVSWPSATKVPALIPIAFTSTDAKGHNHAKHWTTERILATGLIGLIPTAIAFPHPALDYALALSLTMHAHWGLEAVVVDYVRPSIFGETIPKISLAALYGISIFAFGTLCYFNYSDVGIGQAIRMLWTL